MIPLLLYGAVLAIYDTVSSIRRRSVSLIAVIVLFFVASWLVFPLLTDPGLGNMNVIYVCFLVFIVYGIVSLGRIFKRSVMVCLLCMGLSFLLFVNFYFREQNEVYGLHTLFYTTKPGDVIAYARQQYDPQHQKKLYVCLDYSDIDLQNLFAGLYDQVPAEMWTPDGEDYGNIRLNLPEEFDPEEDAVYIIGEDWGGVISYLLSLGFHDDVTFDKEIILYR